jgi:hypothetical protein
LIWEETGHLCATAPDSVTDCFVPHAYRIAAEREAARQAKAAARKARKALSDEQKRQKAMRATRREGLKTVIGWITPDMSSDLRVLSAKSGRPPPCQ